MKWLLVVIVANTPVKTDLIFPTLSECLVAETEMRRQWSDIYNEMQKRSPQPSKESLDFVRSQMVSGTCIPTQ